MKKIFLFLTSLVWLLPLVAYADACSGSGSGIQNPLASAYCNIPQFIAGFLRVMVQVGLPVVALFIFIAGFRFVSATGNEKKLTDARENFKYVMIGALLILGAWIIATLIGNTVSQVVGTSFSL